LVLKVRRLASRTTQHVHGVRVQAPRASRTPPTGHPPNWVREIRTTTGLPHQYGHIVALAADVCACASAQLATGGDQHRSSGVIAGLLSIGSSSAGWIDARRRNVTVMRCLRSG